MKSSLLIATSFFILSISASGAVSAECPVCVEVDKMSKAYADDEAKAYQQFHDYLGAIEDKISADKKTATEEISSLLKGTMLMLKSDDMGELPDYLVAVEDARPAEFAEAFKTLTKDQQKVLKKEMKFSRDFMAEGEEGPNTSKEPAQK